MTNVRPVLRVIRGDVANNVPAERIALSLVHPRERIDVPASAVRIEACGEWIFTDERGRPWSAPSPRVELCFRPDIARRIRRLSRAIVDQPWDIVSGGEVVASPIVRMPLCCPGTSIFVSVFDLEEARALAHRLRTGWRRLGPRAVP
jgi:hypothetical protein